MAAGDVSQAEELVDWLTSDRVLPVTSAFLAAILTFLAGLVRDRQTRIEERRLRQIEIDRDAIRDVQDAAGIYVDSIGMAAVMANVLPQRDLEGRAEIRNEAWMQNWHKSYRQLEINAYRVRDSELRQLALKLLHEAAEHDAFQGAMRDPKKRKALTDKSDLIVTAINERAGELMLRMHRCLHPTDDKPCG